VAVGSDVGKMTLMATEKREKRLVILAGIILVLVLWQALAFVVPLVPSPWPPFYWALPVRGQVVDADTGAPVEGVIVTANWELKSFGWTTISLGQLVVEETVTDKKGQYAFSWWRPRLRWPLWGTLGTDAPGLLFFKSGYQWQGHANDVFSHSNFGLGLFPTSDWNGATIKLKKFQGSEKEYAEHFGHLDVSLSFATGGSARNCEWKKIPRMLAALHLEERRFRKQGIYSSLAPIETMPNQAHCGSAEQFLRSYLP